MDHGAVSENLLNATHRDHLRNDAMAKNQVSITAGDGSLAGVVGTLLVYAFLGLTLWLGLANYLGQQVPIRRRNSNRRNSMINILADTVERGVTQQAQKFQIMKHNSMENNKYRLKKNPRRHEKPIQASPDLTPLGSFSLVSAPVKVHPPEITKTPSISTALPSPLVTPQRHALNSAPNRDVTAIRIPQNTFGNRMKGSQSRKPVKPVPTSSSIGADDTKNQQDHSTSHKPLYLSFPPEMDYNSYKTKPFSLPGSFVNPDRKGNDDITYYYEVPKLPSRSPDRPALTTKEDVTYYYETPPSLATNNRRKQEPVSVPKYNRPYHSATKMPGVHSVKGKGNRKHPIMSQNRRLTNSQQHTSSDRKDIYQRYTFPPRDLLNPKPNKWISSTKSYLSEIPLYTWNWRRVSEGYHRASTKGSSMLPGGDAKRKPGVSETSSKFFPTTLTPGDAPYITPSLESTAKTTTARPTTKLTTAHHTENIGSVGVLPVGFLDYDDVITAFKLGNGVPVNWMPDAELAESETNMEPDKRNLHNKYESKSEGS